jgi:hypothetical protein
MARAQPMLMGERGRAQQLSAVECVRERFGSRTGAVCKKVSHVRRCHARFAWTVPSERKPTGRLLELILKPWRGQPLTEAEKIELAALKERYPPIPTIRSTTLSRHGARRPVRPPLHR